MNSLDKIKEDLAWLAEAKEELKLVEGRVKRQQDKILEAAKELKIHGKIQISYAGRHYEASINVDRIRTKKPSIDEIKNHICKLLPEGERTAENAEKEWNSLCEEAPMKDSVTLRPIHPPVDTKSIKKPEA